MSRQHITIALVAAAAYLGWRWWQHQRFKASIGERAYNSIDMLRPEITGPVIIVPEPRLVI